MRRQRCVPAGRRRRARSPSSGRSCAGGRAHRRVRQLIVDCMPRPGEGTAVQVSTKPPCGFVPCIGVPGGARRARCLRRRQGGAPTAVHTPTTGVVVARRILQAAPGTSGSESPRHGVVRRQARNLGPSHPSHHGVHSVGAPGRGPREPDMGLPRPGCPRATPKDLLGRRCVRLAEG